MGKMDDAVAELNAALNGSTDEVGLAMGRVKGYLRHLKGGKTVQVKGHDRHFEKGATPYERGAHAPQSPYHTALISVRKGDAWDRDLNVERAWDNAMSNPSNETLRALQMELLGAQAKNHHKDPALSAEFKKAADNLKAQISVANKEQDRILSNQSRQELKANPEGLSASEARSKRIGAIAEEARGIRADLEHTGLKNQDLADALREQANALHLESETDSMMGLDNKNKVLAEMLDQHAADAEAAGQARTQAEKLRASYPDNDAAYLRALKMHRDSVYEDAPTRADMKYSDEMDKIISEETAKAATKMASSASEAADRASLPDDLKTAPLVGRLHRGNWLMEDAKGNTVSVTWRSDGTPDIFRFPDTEPLPHEVDSAIQQHKANRDHPLKMSNIDSAEDALIVALANVNVKSYTRRTKTGKSVRVSAYVRRMKGMDLSPGMEVKDSYGKPKTVKTAGPDGVTFTDGSKGGKSQVFTVTSGDPTQSRKSSGYDQARLQAAGNPGATGSKMPAVKSSEGGKVAPMSDAEYEAHTKHIEEEIGKALSEGKATDKQFAVDANSGVWEFDRAQRHREIADAMWKARAAQVPNEGKAMISGGLGGAGKSTVLKIVPGADEKNYFTINSDDVKEHIAENFPDMIPEAGDLSPLERVALIHEESSHIADLLAARAYAEKKNMIWDITMASQKSVQKRLDDLRANGYTDVKGVFVNIDVETSVSRALARHRRGMEDFRNGKGQGGRYVPPHIIRLNKSDKSSSANLDTFTALKDQFDSWDQYNNNVNGRAPQKEGSSSDSGSGSAASSVAADPFVNRTNL